MSDEGLPIATAPANSGVNTSTTDATHQHFQFIPAGMIPPSHVFNSIPYTFRPAGGNASDSIDINEIFSGKKRMSPTVLWEFTVHRSNALHCPTYCRRVLPVRSGFLALLRHVGRIQRGVDAQRSTLESLFRYDQCGVTRWWTSEHRRAARKPRPSVGFAVEFSSRDGADEERRHLDSSVPTSCTAARPGEARAHRRPRQCEQQATVRRDAKERPRRVEIRSETAISIVCYSVCHGSCEWRQDFGTGYPGVSPTRATVRADDDLKRRRRRWLLCRYPLRDH